MAALPPYTVRESARARRVRLTVTPRDGLVVVVPRGLVIDTDAIVASKASWAGRALARVADKHALYTGGAEGLLPARVACPAASLDLAVEYVTAASSRPRVTVVGGVLRVSGDGAEAWLKALRNWVGSIARDVLISRLEQLSRRERVTVQRVRITSARTRWGSCSSKGTISLNRNLVFLPPALLDAVICHELAHRSVMDHSPRFWAHLSKMDSDALRHRAELKRAGDMVPAWADA